MSLLFHPKTLELLYKLKVSVKKAALVDCLSLIIDNTSFIDLTELFKILFSFSQLEIDDSLESIVKNNFFKVKIGNEFRCFYKNINKSKYRAILLENRVLEPGKIGNLLNVNFVDSLILQDKSKITTDRQVGEEIIDLDSISNLQSDKNSQLSACSVVKNKNNSDYFKLDTQQTLNSDIATLDSQLESDLDRKITTKKYKNFQSNTLNFNRIPSNKNVEIKKFEPLSLKNSTYVYDKNNIIIGTLRKRDDLINPVELQFIKHFDQVRPPIYQKKGVLKKLIFSYKKIPEILSYDDDSSAEWEEVNESEESFNETEESKETIESATDWIEKDSEEVETTRFNKKPHFIFEKVKIESYFDKDIFKNANLVLSDYYTDELQSDILKFLSNDNEAYELKIKRVVDMFNITKEGLIKIMSQQIS